MNVADHVDAHRRAGTHFVAAEVRSFALDRGTGEAVVCMHGAPASYYSYRKVVSDLADSGVRGVAFDLPGLGLAERPAIFDCSLANLGTWSAAAVDALGLDGVHLVVHDLGGPIAFEMMPLLGDRVASLTILNTITDPEGFTPPTVMRPFTIGDWT